MSQKSINNSKSNNINDSIIKCKGNNSKLNRISWISMERIYGACVHFKLIYFCNRILFLIHKLSIQTTLSHIQIHRQHHHKILINTLIAQHSTHPYHSHIYTGYRHHHHIHKYTDSTLADIQSHITLAHILLICKHY